MCSSARQVLPGRPSCASLRAGDGAPWTVGLHPGARVVTTFKVPARVEKRRSRTLTPPPPAFRAPCVQTRVPPGPPPALAGCIHWSPPQALSQPLFSVSPLPLKSSADSSPPLCSCGERALLHERGLPPLHRSVSHTPAALPPLLHEASSGFLSARVLVCRGHHPFPVLPLSHGGSGGLPASSPAGSASAPRSLLSLVLTCEEPFGSLRIFIGWV